MKLESIELINQGYGGVKVTGVEAINKGGVTIMIPTTKKYPLPIPLEIVQSIKKLKRYLLEMTNYWLPVYNDHIHNGEIVDRSGDAANADYLRAKLLWESTTIMKIYIRGNGYILSGKMEAITSRFFSLTTPLVTADDGYDNFSKMQTGIQYCFNSISAFVDDKKLKLMDPVDYAKQVFGEDSDEAEKVQALPEGDRHEFMIQVLESKGFIVLGQEDITITDGNTEQPALPEGKKKGKRNED